jgi:hypothetical protein
MDDEQESAEVIAEGKWNTEWCCPSSQEAKCFSCGYN